MGSSSRWGLVFIILAILALIFSLVGPISGLKAKDRMEVQIQSALDGSEFKGVNVDMAGNVAKLSGTVGSSDDKSGLMNFVKSIECEKCKGKKKRSWHAVDGENINVVAPKPKVVAVSPYTFSAAKAGDGKVTLDAYFESEAQKTDVLNHGRNLFGDDLVERNIKLAPGAPAGWTMASKMQLTNLSQVLPGRAMLTDNKATLVGNVGSARAKVMLLENSKLPAGYTLGEALVAPEQTAVVTPPVIETEDACQQELERVKGEDRINFSSGRAEINPESFDLLNRLAGAAKRCPGFLIRVEGHTDDRGDDAYNLALSKRRATTVAAYLADQGVTQDSIVPEGYGEARPVSTNSTPAGRWQNRRIDFVVTRSN